MGELARGVRTIELANDAARAVILPDHGCDIHALIDARTGIDVLFKTPWSRRPAGARTWAPDSKAAWLAEYRGGWPVILPNAGAAADVDGAHRGFHGEASTIPWTEDELAGDCVRLSAQLTSAPLHIEREISLYGKALIIREAVSNRSRLPVEVMWSHHPAFGAPLIGEGCRILVNARTLRADDADAGTDLEPGSLHPWPNATAADGTTLDYSFAPAAGSGRATMAYIEDMAEGACTIWNPALRLGVRLTWPLDVFPTAWLWQEFGATTAFPWFGEADVMAVEPALQRGNGGLDEVHAQGRHALVLAPHQRVHVEIVAELLHDEPAEARPS